jgi:DNA processing protein
MAQGVDSKAHEGALSVAGGETFALLGCGVDVVYPRQNRELYENMLDRGGIISEFPPGTPPRGANFPQRNRLISGLADIVLVVEAREKSGSLITADCALEQGRSIYALPGRVEDSLSCGCNRLIAQGAGIACSPDMLLEELRLERNCKAVSAGESNLGLASDLELVYSCLDFVPKSLQNIQEICGLPALQLMQHLLELQLMGLAHEATKNYYVKKT